jgi:hypothetical protein
MTPSLISTIQTPRQQDINSQTWTNYMNRNADNLMSNNCENP